MCFPDRASGLEIAQLFRNRARVTIIFGYEFYVPLDRRVEGVEFGLALPVESALLFSQAVYFGLEPLGERFVQVFVTEGDILEADKKLMLS